MRRCARPGLFRTPSRSEDLLRAAAIKQRAQKTPVGWLGVCTPKQFRRTCTSVSPFFAMTGRRLGVRTSHHKFMQSPKSCRKNPNAVGTTVSLIIPPRDARLIIGGSNGQHGESPQHKEGLIHPTEPQTHRIYYENS